jgi:hypothetical protein
MPPHKPQNKYTRTKTGETVEVKPVSLKVPELNNDGGFIRLRNGIWEHIKSGFITCNDFAVYLTIHKFTNWKTGICMSNAASMTEAWGDFSRAANKVEQFQNSMRHLRANGYIDYPEGSGKRGNYPILIDKAEPTKGPLRGWRLRLAAGEPGSSNFSNPWYQYVSPTPFEEAYPDVQVEVQAVDWRVVQVEVQAVVQVEGQAEVPTVALPLQDILDLLKTYSKTAFKTTEKIKYNNLPTGADAPSKSVVVNESYIIHDETEKDLEIRDRDNSEQDVDAVTEQGSRSVNRNYHPTPDSNPVSTSTSTPDVELTDIRDWNTPALGLSAERLRNCLIYVLDHRVDNYYRNNPPTETSMRRENFIRKLDADTPHGWTPESVTKKEQKKHEGLKHYDYDEAYNLPD